MAPHLPPRWGSLGKRLLIPQDFPALARAPPSPEPGAVPVPGARPSNGCRATRSGPGSPPLVVRAGGAEGRRAVLATRGPGLTRAAQLLRCASAARPRSPQTASPAPIAGPAAPAKRSARPEPHPEGGSAAGEVGASRPAGQRPLPTRLASPGRGVGSRGCAGRWRGARACQGRPHSQPGVALWSRLPVSPRLPEVWPLRGHPESTHFAASRVLTAPSSVHSLAFPILTVTSRGCAMSLAPQ